MRRERESGLCRGFRRARCSRRSILAATNSRCSGVSSRWAFSRWASRWCGATRVFCPRPGPVLRPRRLCARDASQARRAESRRSSRLHAMERARHIAVAVGAIQERAVRSGRGGCDTRRPGRGARLAGLSSARRRSLFRDNHSGAGAGGDDVYHQPAGLYRRLQWPDGFQQRVWL